MNVAKPIVADRAYKEHRRVVIKVFKDLILPRSLSGLNNLNVLSAAIPEFSPCSGSITFTNPVIAEDATTIKSRTFHPSLK